ncbi:hypothetical protein ABG067_006280 [Albugo candida]
MTRKLKLSRRRVARSRVISVFPSKQQSSYINSQSSNMHIQWIVSLIVAAVACIENAKANTENGHEGDVDHPDGGARALNSPSTPKKPVNLLEAYPGRKPFTLPQN